MDIKSLNNRNFIKRTQLDSVDAGKAKQAYSESSSTSTRSDIVSLKSVNIDEVSFAQQAYQRLDAQFSDTIKSVRSRINSQQYEQPEVYAELATRISRQMTQLEADQFDLSSLSSSSSKTIDIEKLQAELADNDEITAEIATRLSNFMINF